MNQKSSTSDNGRYPEFCLQAAQDEVIFNNFKSNPIYNMILEHVDYNLGLAYYNEFKENQDLVDNLDKFKINDKFGNTYKTNFPFGIFSPSTMRYVKTLNDLLSFRIEDSNIIEIGGGYGGQCAIIKSHVNIKSYSIVDITGPIKLTEKYLTKLGMNENVSFIDANDEFSFENSYDLIISNYAISECNIEVQKYYIENILSKSKQGYILHNQFYGYSLNEFISILKDMNKNIECTQEVPLSGTKNMLITWR